MRQIIYGLIFIFFLGTSCHRAISRQTLEENLQSIVELKRIAGFGVAIFDKDSIYFAKGYGFADVEKQIPYTRETPQIMASVSKMFIGFSLLKCQELGWLDLQEPINSYLPFEIRNPHFPEVAITLEHLATHTASFKYSERMSDELNYAYSDSSLLFYMKNYFASEGAWYAEENFHTAKPGEIWDYSNMGAVLAAAIVEEVSGMEYANFVEKYLFVPLGAHQSSRFSELASRTIHYEGDSLGNFEEIPHRKMGLYPAGDFLSTTLDMVKFIQMVMNEGNAGYNELLQQSSVAYMLEGHIQKDIEWIDAEGYDHGIFWIHDKNILGNPQKVKGYLGGDTGIFTSVWFEPRSGRGYVFCSNTGRSSVNFNATIYIWQSLYKYAKSLK